MTEEEYKEHYAMYVTREVFFPLDDPNVKDLEVSPIKSMKKQGLLTKNYRLTDINDIMGWLGCG